MIDRALEREVRRRGEIVGNVLRHGLPDGIGTGISPLHLMIVFRGDLPPHQGGGGSNDAALTALDRYERSEAAVYQETLQALQPLIDHQPAALRFWLAHYAMPGPSTTKARACGVGRMSYQRKLSAVEMMVAGALVAAGLWHRREAEAS